MPWLLLLLLLLPAAGQTPRKRTRPVPAATPSSPASYTLQNVSVTGVQRFTAAQVIAASGLTVGQKVTKADFDTAREKLLATGNFATVGYRFAPAKSAEGYDATWEVAEVTPAYSFRFEELNAPVADITAWLKSSDPLYTSQLTGSQVVFDRYARLLEDFLSRQGQKQSVVGRLTTEAGGKISVVFRPNVPAQTIAEIRFTGNEAIPTPTLQNAVAGVAVGAAYSEVRMQEYLDNSVRRLYEAQGRLRVSFPKVTVTPAKDVRGLIVQVQVNEGQVYQLGKVTITGAIGSTDELIKLGGFKSGETLNMDAVQSGVDKIVQSFKRNGYLQAKSRTDRALDDAQHRADLTIAIERGTQYTFHALQIEGLNIETEPAVRKLWGMSPGKPFNPEYPDYFLNRVREEGIFDNLQKTRSAYRLNDANHTVDVTLTFNK